MDKINYQNQAEANVDVFAEFVDYQSKKHVLKELIRAFEEYGVKWALTCSANLFFRGIVDTFTDYDILIATESCEQFKEVMRMLSATTIPRGDQSCFNSTYFNRFKVEDVGIDVISEWRVVTFGTMYLCELVTDELDYIEVEKNKIPIIPMEKNFLLYGMMEGWQPQRQFKRRLCEEYLLSVGTKHSEILEKALNYNDFPIWLKKRIRHILSVSA